MIFSFGNMSVTVMFPLKMYKVEEVEWNCHLNVRCVNIFFRSFNGIIIKKDTSEIRHSVF